MPLAIPLQAVPSQTVSVALNNQACQINVYVLNNDLYIDLLVNDALIIGGVVCQNLNVIVRDAYLGFVGDLAFVDTQAGPNGENASNPVYTGLGSRFILVYYFPVDLPAGLS